MSLNIKVAGIGVGLVMAAIGFANSAAAQYRSYDPDPDYDRRGRYDRGERYDRRDGYERAPNRGGYERDRRDYGQQDYGQRVGGGPGVGRGNNPLAGMSLEDQKRAIKNQREAQKKAIKRGYVAPLR